MLIYYKDVLSNLLENYPILKDVLSCSKAKNLSNLNLHFFQITNENIKSKHGLFIYIRFEKLTLMIYW